MSPRIGLRCVCVELYFVEAWPHTPLGIECYGYVCVKLYCSFTITYSLPEQDGGRDYVCDVRVWHRQENRVMGVYRGEAPRKPTAERIARKKAIAAIRADRFES